MASPDGSRLATELELLEAMYPGQTEFDPRSRDLRFLDQSALLHLRIPDFYPSTGLPDVMSASDKGKNDIREEIRAGIKELDLAEGMEALDAIVAYFQDRVAAIEDAKQNQAIAENQQRLASNADEPSRTVIIWLHHLLALSKRKLAVSPSSLSGLTKPGYPGIMLFSGPKSAVREHVDALRAQNWQAFQVRYDENELWEFEHGGVREVETMAELARAIDVGEYGSRHKEEFLKAAGIK
jgi:hypothetical protein